MINVQRFQANQVKTKKTKVSPKLEEFLSPKSREDQKKKLQRSSSAQMYSQIIGQLRSNYWGDISPLGFQHSCRKAAQF